MSHLIYRNLAKVQGFDRNLNYTGIILDNWDDPLNLIPVVLCVLCLINGLPRSFQAWWALSNAVIFHPMDFIVGAFGRGPKYLSDEYAVMDTRYWPLDEPVVAWISYIELAIMLPLCFAWYRGIVQKKWYRHYFALLASTFQMMGCILYVATEWNVNFDHLPTHDWSWPPGFDGYLKIKYFWLIFVGCNMVWIIVPLYIYYFSFTEMSKLLSRKTKLN